jgi:hypothetical protein
MTEVQLPIAGGCQCGRLRYAVDLPPLFLHACHCKDCQVRTGSAFSMAMRVPSAGFRVTSGDTVTVERISPKNAVSVQHHCVQCLVRTHTTHPAHPEVVTVRPGTLDDTRWVTPAVQLWRDSAMAWAVSDTVPAACREPDDYIGYRADWRAGTVFLKP